MDAKEKRVYSMIVEEFNKNSIQVFLANYPSSKLYKLESVVIQSVGTIKQEIKKFIASKELKNDAVFIYAVTATQNNNSGGVVDWKYTITLDLQ